jgi:hypothetical protein
MSDELCENGYKTVGLMDQDLFTNVPPAVVAMFVVDGILSSEHRIKQILMLPEKVADVLGIPLDKVREDLAKDSVTTFVYNWNEMHARGAVSEPLPERFRHLLPTPEEVEQSKARSQSRI